MSAFPAKSRAAETARALASRVPYPLWALAILAAFAAVGATILDDYGTHFDEIAQREIALSNLRYIQGDAEADIHLLPQHQERYYGMALELSAIFAARALGIDELQGIYLVRRLMTHLIFLCGAFACFILAYRLFNSLPIALLAMLLFLLHPRLYAHSIFNSKDSPFFAMFMIALLIAHWAFAKNSVWAFALLGVWVALAMNIRIMGIILVPAMLGMRALDLFHAPQWTGQSGRVKILLSCAVFAAALAAVFYISAPYLWSDPLSFIDAARTFSNVGTAPTFEQYRGVVLKSTTLPWDYIPVYLAITTPPLTLLFGALGAAAVVRRGAADPGAIFRVGDIRFGFLLIALFALPIIGVAALDVNTYNGWRHTHFIYAPLCLLAAFALHLLPREFKRGTRRESFARWGTRALMCAGLAAALIAIIQTHPNQQRYFNFFVDRETPELLRTQFRMDYWRISTLQGLRHLLELHPSEPVFVNEKALQAAYVLSSEQLRRIIIDADADPLNNYHIIPRGEGDDEYYAETDILYSVKIYNNSLTVVYGDMPTHHARVAEHAARRRELRAAVSSMDPEVSDRYDVYIYPEGNSIVYVKEQCAQGDMADQFFLHIHPENPADLPEDHKPRGFENADFNLMNPRMGPDPRDADVEFASFMGEECLASVSLPNYPIARIETGQFNLDDGALWGETIVVYGDIANYRAKVAERAARRRELRAAAASAEPAARAHYDIYFYPEEDSLVYLKEQCAEGDIADNFFLHIHPENPDYLSESRKPHGFDNADFSLMNHIKGRGPTASAVEFASFIEGECLASVRLPDYPIAHIATGQFNADGRIWSEDIDFAAANN